MFRSSKGTKRRSIPIAVLALVFIAGILAVLLFDYTIHATSSNAFCTSCHSMQITKQEYEASIHYANASGVSATCADCHIPEAFVPKMITKVIALKDIYHELAGTIDTPEKYEAHRWTMANRVWGQMISNDSRECRGCHNDERMVTSVQSELAVQSHERARNEGYTCVQCHKGVAHTLPEEPDEE
jgi:cytochrome c-type protein NapC